MSVWCIHAVYGCTLTTKLPPTHPDVFTSGSKKRWKCRIQNVEPTTGDVGCGHIQPWVHLIAATDLTCFYILSFSFFLFELAVACLLCGQCGVRAWQLLFKSRSDGRCPHVKKKKVLVLGVLPWIKDRRSLMVKGKVTVTQTAFSHQLVTCKQWGLRSTEV